MEPRLRFGYIEVLFHTLYCNWGRKYRSLYQGLRYIEVPLYEREREIGLTPLLRFWLLSQFAHSHPFESRIIPTPLPRQFSLEEVLDCSTCTWQFNSYSTIISADRTKWLSINSLLFWKIGRVIVQRGREGGGGCICPSSNLPFIIRFTVLYFSVRSSGSKTLR